MSKLSMGHPGDTRKNRNSAAVWLVAVAMATAGCVAGSSVTPSTSPPAMNTETVGMAGHNLMATITGRVYTTDCGGPPGVLSCIATTPVSYRGVLVFCRSMHERGFCPSAAVDATGHYRIVLRGVGRWAVMPAPGSGNVVLVKPRWISVRPGTTTTLNIRGGNLMR